VRRALFLQAPLPDGLQRLDDLVIALPTHPLIVGRRNNDREHVLIPVRVDANHVIHLV
jgi:hypothetical protein